MAYKTEVRRGWELGVLDEISTAMDNDVGIEKGKVAEPPALEPIVEAAKKGDWASVKCEMAKLRRATRYKGLGYNERFGTSGFADLLVDLLGNRDMCAHALEVIVNLSRLESGVSAMYMGVLCEKNLVGVISDVSGKDVPPAVATNMLCVLMNCVLIGPRFRDLVMQTLNFERICKLPNVEPKYVVCFFRNLLKYPMEEEQSRAFVEPLKFLWTRYIGTENVVFVLQLFCFACTQESLLIFLSQERELAHRIADMLITRSDKVLRFVLFLCNKFVRAGGIGFEVVVEKITQVIQILGSDNIEIAAAAAALVSYLLKHELSVVPEEKYDDIARRCFARWNRAEVVSKKPFLKCLLLLLPSLPDNALRVIVEQGFPDNLRDLLGTMCSSMTAKVLMFVSDLVGRRQDEFGRALMNAMISDGGTEELEAMTMSEDAALATAARELLAKAKETAQ